MSEMRDEYFEAQNPSGSSKPFLSNRQYDILKFIAQIFLPALGTLYFALAGYWDLPKAEEVVGTIVAFDVFLGVLLGLSTRSYNQSDARFDGAIEVEHRNDDSKMFSLVLDATPEELEEKDEVVFKVRPTQQ